jgi:hypothetical protein
MQIAKLGFARYREAMQLACCTAVELELTATAGQSFEKHHPRRPTSMTSVIPFIMAPRCSTI